MKKIILFIGIIVSLGSCEDAIDIVQPGELGLEETFETVDDLEQGIDWVYSNVAYNSIIALNSIWTDEVGIGFANGGQGLINDAEYTLNMNAGHGYPNSIWLSNYRLINFATRILVAAEGITPEDSGELQRYNDVIAQASALRAWGHFTLLTYFSTDLSNDNALGVIAVDFIPSIADELPRNTNGEIFALIESDLNFAEAHLGANSNVTYLSQDALTAFRARMAVYRENYPAAQQYAQDLINATPLSPRNEYRQIWTDEAVGEVIWKLERTTGDSPIGSLWQNVSHTITGSPFFEVGRALFNKLDTQDVRYDVIVGPESVIDPNYETSDDYRNTDILLINKYPGSEGQNRLNDIKIFRASEMYFIKAEAQIDQGDLVGAAQTLQQLRVVRYAPNPAPALPTYANATQAWADVLAERRIELAFEGHRWVDLKRLGEKANAQIDRDPRDCESINTCTIPINDYRFTLPIPVSEISANNAIGSQQNPGY